MKLARSSCETSLLRIWKTRAFCVTVSVFHNSGHLLSLLCHPAKEKAWKCLESGRCNNRVLMLLLSSLELFLLPCASLLITGIFREKTLFIISDTLKHNFSYIIIRTCCHVLNNEGLN